MPVKVILGMVWGDESKGKLVDIMSENADFTARFQGGGNAGHTIKIGVGKSQRTIVLNHIPSGIIRPHCRAVMGNGMVIDPITTVNKELKDLLMFDVDVTGRLLIDFGAHVVQPIHRAIDQLQESKRTVKIGTTGRGIGPAYADKINRVGISMWDILRDWDNISDRMKRRLDAHPEKEALLTMEALQGDWLSEFLTASEQLRPFIVDAQTILLDALDSGSFVLAEGAQGSLLDIDHGTYPFVTSSNTCIGGVFNGLGIPPKFVESTTGVFKAYVTRVGGGPFPTEIHGPIGLQIAETGQEFGATTGRPRQCGWFDVPAARHAIRVNGIDGICLAKLDVLTGIRELKICTHYEYDGKLLDCATPIMRDLAHVTPILESINGWDSLGLVPGNCIGDLEVDAKAYVERIQELLGVPITSVGYGPERSALLQAG